MTLTPEIDFDGVDYIFLSQQITTVPIDTLKVTVGTLEESRAILIDAIDFAITDYLNANRSNSDVAALNAVLLTEYFD
ncbi:CcdB family protein [Alteromonas hispanica]|uniref:Toxin CcdB n=1 Tax=Alteromonas hispanica TaxID=315421 RepID=A0A6L9MWB8_9ALTE|nr:hypothetical protein [Alteromonas hispanica]